MDTEKKLTDMAQLEGMFGDRNTFLAALPETERGSALRYIDSTPDAAEAEDRRMWMANVHLMAKTFRQPVQDVAANYDKFQMGYLAQVLKQEPRDMPSAEFHGLVKQRMEKRRALQGGLDTIIHWMTEDYYEEARPDFDKAFAKRLSEYDKAGAIDTEDRDVLRTAAAKQWSRLTETEVVTAEAIHAAAEYFVKGREVSVTGLSDEQTRAVDALSKLSEDDQRFAISRAAAIARTPKPAEGEEPGFMGKLAKLTARSISEPLRDVVAAGAEAGVDIVRLHPAAQAEAMKTGADALTSEKVYGRMEAEGLGALSPRRMEIERKLAGALAGKADKVDLGGWVQKSILLASSNAVRMGISLNPVGMTLNAVAYSKELEGELRDRGVPAAQAKNLGRVGAPVMAAIDFVQSGLALKGWKPGGKTLVAQVANQVAKFGAVAGIETVEQVGQETAQDIVAPLLQAAGAVVDPSIPKLIAREEFARLRQSAPDNLAAMLPYALLGTARTRWKDRHAEMLYLKNRDAAEAMGFPDDVTDAIADAPDAETIAALYRENVGQHDMTTPEALAAQERLKKAGQAIDLSDGGASLLTPEEIAAEEAGKAKLGAAALDVRFDNDERIELVDQGGTVVATAQTPTEAAEIALRYQKNEAALAEASAWAESQNELPEDAKINVVPERRVVGEDGFSRTYPATASVTFTVTNERTGKIRERTLSAEQAQAEGYAVPTPPPAMAAGSYSVPEVLSAAAPKAPEVALPAADDTEVYRLVQADIAQSRETFPGAKLEELPAPERQTTISNMIAAKKRPVDENGVERLSQVEMSDSLAVGLVMKPRTISPVEHAGMVIRAGQLLNSYRTTMATAAALHRDGNFTAAQEQFKVAENIGGLYEAVTRAANLAGTEAGRSLAARRWTAIDLKTYDLVSMVNRMQAASGKEVDADTKAKLVEVTKAHDENKAKIDALEATQREEQAKQDKEDVKEFVKQAKAGKKPATRNDKAKKGEKPKTLTREELLEKLTKLEFDPVKGGEVTPAVADVLAKLGEFHVEAGAKTLSDITGKVKEDVPAVSEDTIHQAFAGKIAEDAEPKTELQRRVGEYKKQAGLWSDIHAILETGKPEEGKAAPEASEKVKQLREILAELRYNSLKEERDDAKMADLNRRFNQVQDQLERGYRMIPERKGEKQEAPGVEAVRKQIADLERKMAVEDSIFTLEERIRRKAPPEQKRRVELNDELFQAYRRKQELQRELARIEASYRPKTAWGLVGDAGEFMRSAKATADISAAFRQAVFLGPRRPVEFTKAFGKALVAFFDSEYSDRIEWELRRQPQQIARDRAGLYLSSVDSKMTGREESFQSSLAERIPGVGAVVRGSNRNMVTMLNLMRVAAFDTFREANPDANTETLSAMASYVNVATGRGDLGRFQASANVLAKLAFSPRFFVSRFQLLGSPFYFAARDKKVAKEVAKDWVAFVTSGMAVLTLAHLAGAKVGIEPEDSEFGKIRVGKVVIDIFGGLQQPARLMMVAARKTMDNAGIIDVKKDVNMLDYGMRYLFYRASPGISGTYAILFGENILGEEQGIGEAAVRSITPITIEQSVDAWNDTDGDAGSVLTATALSSVGVGVQTYPPKKGSGSRGSGGRGVGRGGGGGGRKTGRSD